MGPPFYVGVFLLWRSSFGLFCAKNRENPFGILTVYGFLRCGA